MTITDVIKKIAIICLKEFAVSLTLGLAVVAFVHTLEGIALMISAALIQCAVSLFFHSLGAFACYKAAQKGPNQVFFGRVLSICEWMTGANFALFTGFNTQTLIHETGHMLAAFATYAKPRPQIEIYPFVGGLTQFCKTSRSSFGKKIGPVATTCLIVASGPGFALLISSILLAVGIAIKGKHPHLGKYLITWSILDFFTEADYAYSALRTDPSNLFHDYAHLSIFGLHPAVATIGIIAIPIVITLGTNWWQGRAKPLKIKPQYQPV